MWLGVRPIIALASEPTARTWLVLVLIATTDGSFRTTPRPRTYASVLAVPRSTAMSRPRKRKAFFKGDHPLQAITDVDEAQGTAVRSCAAGAGSPRELGEE